MQTQNLAPTEYLVPRIAPSRTRGNSTEQETGTRAQCGIQFPYSMIITMDA